MELLGILIVVLMVGGTLTAIKLIEDSNKNSHLHEGVSAEGYTKKGALNPFVKQLPLNIEYIAKLRNRARQEDMTIVSITMNPKDAKELKGYIKKLMNNEYQNHQKDSKIVKIYGIDLQESKTVPKGYIEVVKMRKI